MSQQGMTQLMSALNKNDVEVNVSDNSEPAQPKINNRISVPATRIFRNQPPVQSIPKNLSKPGPRPMRPPEQPAQHEIQHEIQHAGVDNNYYSLFGYQLSTTTVYIIVGFILIIVGYYLYKYFMSGDKKDKKKRKQQVSYEEQEKLLEDEE